MTDSEFLNDRDCTPKGKTPRTEAALCQLRYYETRNGDRHEEQLTYIEPEFARELERELTRALRVVEAAKQWTQDSMGRYEIHHALHQAIEEWEAGR